MRILLAVLILFCAGLAAQDTPAPEGSKPTEQPAPAAPKEEPVTELGLQADFNLYVKRNYPQIDPAGEHDIFKLKNPTDPAKRHEYTVAMSMLILMYVEHVNLGPTLVKLFDQFARGKEASQPVFKVLYAHVITSYPPGNPENVARARKLLLEASAQAADYAYPQYLLGEIELGTAGRRGDEALKEALKHAEAALAIKPDFAAAAGMKADLLSMARPPRTAEAVKLLDSILAKPPAAAEDLELIVVAYLRSAGIQAGLEVIKKLLARTDISKPAIARVRRLGASALQQSGNLDEAIAWTEHALKDLTPEADVLPYIGGAVFLANCWGSKALALRTGKQPTPEELRNFDKYFDEATVWYRKAVDVEARFLPIEMRGRQAFEYMEFLINCKRFEEALIWLDKYLKVASLPAQTRSGLELRALRLRILLNPEEDHLVQNFENLAKADDVAALASALDAAVASLGAGSSFKSERALNFFTTQLKSRNRAVVMCCVILSAHTAVSRGGAESGKVAEAIVARLEEETECKNNEQMMLQRSMCERIRVLKQWVPLARAIRHVKKMVEGERARLNNYIARVTAVFSGEQLTALVPGAPQPLGVNDSKDPAKLAPWLEDVAKLLDKQPQEAPGKSESSSEEKKPG